MADHKINATKFYRDDFKDEHAIWRNKTVCIKEITLSQNASGQENFYARGSTVCSRRDQFCRKTGRQIAEQRAEKAIEWFEKVGYDVGKYNYNFGDYAHMISMLRAQELSDFEKRLMCVSEPVKKEEKQLEASLIGDWFWKTSA